MATVPVFEVLGIGDNHARRNYHENGKPTSGTVIGRVTWLHSHLHKKCSTRGLSMIVVTAIRVTLIQCKMLTLLNEYRRSGTHSNGRFRKKSSVQQPWTLVSSSLSDHLEPITRNIFPVKAITCFLCVHKY